MNPISIALRGKGLRKTAQRSANIVRNYGLTPTTMDQALQLFMNILEEYDCQATFPITAVTLKRNPQVIEKYNKQGIEFAIHGYRHLDHHQLSRYDQQIQLQQAKQLFDQANIEVKGFRGPYLHANGDTLSALQRLNLTYDSSQAFSWNVMNGQDTPAYNHALSFYGALPANRYPSLPSLKDNLVLIPYSLPDDEALAHRLSITNTSKMNELWVEVLRQSYDLGELFTLGLHPERVVICQEALAAVLAEARRLTPKVWIARLDELAAWWRARYSTQIKIVDLAGNKFGFEITGPVGIQVLVRDVEIDAPTYLWAKGFYRTDATKFTASTRIRPYIGLSATTSRELSSFLQQQGYITEFSYDSHDYAYYIDQANFSFEDRRPLLAKLEETNCPLVRLSRWPESALSALSITGDIDALTLWDYGLRFLGR